jgi:NADPH:quinone reductase-like Zn-dependent oxidoreductase
MKSILVYGGSGALGRDVISFFNSAGWSTTSVVSEAQSSKVCAHVVNQQYQDLGVSETASKNVVIPGNVHWGEQLKHVQQEVVADKYDVIYCAAGGWAGGGERDFAVFDKDVFG